MNELFEAVKKGDAEVVKSLLATGALVDAVNQYGSTPLHWAAKNGYESVVQALLAGGVLVDAVNQYGYTPLHWAAKNGYEAVVQALLAGGSDPNIRGWRDYTPLQWAAKNGYEAVVDLLLEAGADITLLKKDSVERELCQNILNGLLRSAVISNNIVKVQAYIAIGAGVNATDDDGAMPLHLAAKKGDAEVVKSLLAGGADSNIRGWRDYTPLHWAALRGHAAIVNVLVQAGALVDAVNQYGSTTLIFAADKGHEAVFKALLEAGADPKPENNDVSAALLWVVRKGLASISSEFQKHIRSGEYKWRQHLPYLKKSAWNYYNSKSMTGIAEKLALETESEEEETASIESITDRLIPCFLRSISLPQRKRLAFAKLFNGKFSKTSPGKDLSVDILLTIGQMLVAKSKTIPEIMEEFAKKMAKTRAVASAKSGKRSAKRQKIEAVEAAATPAP